MNAAATKTTRSRVLSTLGAFLLSCWSLAPAYASDTEVYARLIEIDSADAAPTLMMMLDSSNFMNYCMDDTTTTESGTACADPDDARLTILRRAMRKALFGNPLPSQGSIIKPAPGFLRMGYSRFMPTANDGAWVRYPALALDDVITVDSSTAGFKSIPIERRVTVSGSDARYELSTGNTVLGDGTFTFGPGRDYVALNFKDLKVPRGATIVSAKLTFTSASGNQTPAVYAIGDMSSNSNGFDTTPIFDVSRNWAVASTMQANPLSLDVTGVVQSIVNQNNPVGASWCGGNAMSLLVVSDSTGAASKTRTVYAFDGTGVTTTEVAKRPRLQVVWSLTDPAKLVDSCNVVALDSVSLVDSVYDDIEWLDTTPAVTPRNNTMRAAGIFGGKKNMIAVRFDKLAMEQKANVEYAYLYSTLSGGDADTEAPVIQVEALRQGNVAKFCDTAVTPVKCTHPDISSLSSTAAKFEMPYLLDAGGLPVKSGVNFVANVTAQVQEVLDLPGWTTGNTMGFVLQNAGTTSSLRGLAAADEGLSKSMVLHVRSTAKYTDLTKLPRTVRQDLLEDIDTKMIADGGTPLGDAYQETARYLLGGKLPKTQKASATLTVDGTPTPFPTPDPRTLTTMTNADGTVSTVYNSPVDKTGDSCSATYIFALSDGVPKNASNVSQNTADLLDDAPTVPGLASCGNGITFPADFTLTGNEKTNFQCMATLAKYLYTKDVRDPDVAKDTYKPIIRTNTVLFHGVPDEQLLKGLKLVADAGGGKPYVAKNEDEVLKAIMETLRAVIEKTGSITAPGVAVNQFNRLTHLDQLYYAVFDPDQGNARWRGNVKRYRLKFTETDALIVDRNDDPAIDSDTFFSDEAWSFWSDDRDGKTTSKGGMASKLPTPGSRRIYTTFADYSTDTPSTSMSLSTLSTADTTTVGAAKAQMGLSTNIQAINVLNWLLGYDINVQDPASSPESPTVASGASPISTTGVPARSAIGGVLHSQPVLVNYGYTGTSADAAATNADLQKNYLFFSTMEGMLHVVDVKSTRGVEEFAFMPKETLTNGPDLALNAPRNDPHFGMDLTWAVLREDANKDLQITGDGRTAGADKVWVFGGMRMGGSNYYGLNVTNLGSPELKWVLQSGVGEFAKMGQTWSRPVLGDVKIGSTVKTVLFFAGGYDPKHEIAGYDPLSSASDTLGNQIYIVDPDTGAVLFWASGTGSGAHLESADLKYSVPAELKLFDGNKDGLVDAVYFGDLGGQVFRLDLNESGVSAASLGARLKLLATIGQEVNPDTTNQRRFYEPPSVATMLDPLTSKPYVGVAMGTGYRSHPLDEATQDTFYFFRDNDILRPDRLTASDLQATIKATDLATVDVTSKAGVDMTGKMGWQMFLPDSGEKVIASPILLFGEVFFTSYVPRQSLATSKCSPVIGVTKLWRMSATDAAVIKDMNHDGVIDEKDRFTDNLVEGLGGAPQLLVGEDGKNAIVAGTGVERNEDLSSASMRRTRWYEKSKQ
jgi:type IV pilus assembly protein PilY1